MCGLGIEPTIRRYRIARRERWWSVDDVREQRLEELRERMGNKLAEIAEWFVNPKITIVVRAPHLNDGDVVLTDDDVELAIAAIRKLYGSPGKGGA